MSESANEERSGGGLMAIDVKSDCALPDNWFYQGEIWQRDPRPGCSCDACEWNRKRIAETIAQLEAP